MGHIVWNTEDEIYCVDCGQEGVNNCSCLQCDECGRYSLAYDEVEEMILCMDCIEAMLEKKLHRRRRQRKRLVR